MHREWQVQRIFQLPFPVMRSFHNLPLHVSGSAPKHSHHLLGVAIGGEVEDYQITLLCAIPDPPEVSDNAPENLCPEVTVDLTALVTSSTPEGGALLFKTENNPSGADLADPSQASAGHILPFLHEC
jgi:hypothetical protein